MQKYNSETRKILSAKSTTRQHAGLSFYKGKNIFGARRNKLNVVSMNPFVGLYFVRK
tara:strand:+ start:218 stop:388 length:171 start_codon:yes stop_codon:yes gene_type:complete